MLSSLSKPTTSKASTLKHIQELSYGEADTGNMLIHGDNLSVLPALRDRYAKKVKCVYIDPPYNNGEKYSHYNDDESSAHWLEKLKSTLILLKPLISEDGSIWISIDDSEMHYLKIVADTVFGRDNFIATIVWQQRTTRENRSIFSRNHEYILVYAINPKAFKASRNLLPLTSQVAERYKNPDNDVRGPWQSISANVQAGHATEGQFYNIVSPSGKVHYPPNGRCWAYNQERMSKEIEQNNIWFGAKGTAVPRVKKFLNSSSVGLNPETLWLGNDVGTNKLAKQHLLTLFPNGVVFDTPKPEQLIGRIIEIATNEGELVLDCYLGSGSTVSTAHKMKRKYIGIEIGNHISDLVSKRMRSVIDGEKGGISKNIGWPGGGGFDFYLKKNRH